jgi:hypothetical protein
LFYFEIHSHFLPILSFPPLLGWQMHTTTHCFFNWDEVSQTSFPWGWPGNVILVISASCVAWDDNMCHCTKLLVEMGVSQTFCSGWPQIASFLISASQVARVPSSNFSNFDKPIYIYIYIYICFSLSEFVAIKKVMLQYH